MTQVTFPVAVGGSGDTFSDDGTSGRDMGNGGHRLNLLPMLVQTVLMAQSAAAAALSAVNAPGSAGTSVTNLAIAGGVAGLTTQAGKAFVVGQSVKIASTADPTKWMHGDITAYNGGTGALTVNVTSINGSGTYASWQISLSAPANADTQPYGSTNANITLLRADLGRFLDITGGTITVSYAAVATLGDGWYVWVRNLAGSGAATHDPNGAELINGAASITQAVGDLWLVFVTGGAFKAVQVASQSVTNAVNATNATTATTAGTCTGNSASATYSKQVPPSATAGTLVAADAGKQVALTAGITVPANIFAAGDAVCLYNDTAGSLSVTQGAGLTLRMAGTATTGSRTLAQRGMATVWFRSATEAVISGAGLT